MLQRRDAVLVDNWLEAAGQVCVGTWLGHSVDRAHCAGRALGALASLPQAVVFGPESLGTGDTGDAVLCQGGPECTWRTHAGYAHAFTLACSARWTRVTRHTLHSGCIIAGQTLGSLNRSQQLCVASSRGGLRCGGTEWADETRWAQTATTRIVRRTLAIETLRALLGVEKVSNLYRVVAHSGEAVCARSTRVRSQGRIVTERINSHGAVGAVKPSRASEVGGSQSVLRAHETRWTNGGSHATKSRTDVTARAQRTLTHSDLC